ncbi:MAG: LptF/LptG family permease [Candidatus Gastranaerophilales bacterium]|nr:LptF/LptG family permease [Candidatus Gastranaerophilales bacterium]
MNGKDFKKYIRFLKIKTASVSMLDKYILRQLIEVFVLGVIIFTSIIFASETFTQLIKQITQFGIPFNIAIMMVVLNLPQVFVMTIPISTLFATVMTVNKLSLNSEITVLRACGIGIARIAKPIFAFAILMTVVSFLINEFIVPAASTQAKYLAIYSLQKKHVPEGRMNYTLNETDKEGRLKRLFYVQKCEDKTLNNITVLDLSNDDTVQIIQAKVGKTADSGWIFDGGVMYTLSTTEKILNTTLFERSNINFGIENLDSLVKDEASQYNFFRLMKFIQKNKKNPDILEKLKLELQVQLYDKLALPVTTFALALVGIPLAITPPRVRYNRGFLFSVMIIFVYYVIRAFSLNLGETKAISPFLAAWLPVISIAVIGWILYRRKAYTIT